MIADEPLDGAAERRRSGLGFALAVSLVEALDSTTGVDQLLLAGEERMALVAQFDVEVATTGRAGLERVSTGTLDCGERVTGVDVSFHGVRFLLV